MPRRREDWFTRSETVRRFRLRTTILLERRAREGARIMRDKFAFSVSALEILDSAFILGGERDIDVTPIDRGCFRVSREEKLICSELRN